MNTNQSNQTLTPTTPNQETINTSSFTQTPVQPEPPKKKAPWLLISIIVLLLSATGVLGYKYYELQQKVEKLQQPTPLPTPQLVVSSPSPLQTSQGESLNVENYAYNNFSFTYTDDWILSDMSSSDKFPLKARLDPLYSGDKVVSLSKNNLYLIITIDKESEGSAGGIFIDDSDYNEFTSSRDKVLIGDSTFYLLKEHPATPTLIESHSGPYMWGALSEYIPNKKTGSGNVFKGHEDIIKRGEYIYNFIITSEEGGTTDQQLQQEIINMLESIKW
ncbi:hypothetical protein HOD19_00115 [bacterium]|jgi:hypothetical protein|nr:hypothetical protein [bacterium]